MKTIIYQALARLWRNGRMSDWDSASFEYLKSLGITHVWYTGIPRHASGKDFVKGDPGSPYAISDWFDINPYLATDPSKRMDEFKDLVHRTHEAGLKCIIDFIPNHVAVDYCGKIGVHDWCDGDWTDTRKVDYDNPATVPAFKEILEFWASTGIDGFRCDMVELVPIQALRELISSTKAKYPELLFIGEAYSRENYRPYIDEAGFDLLYDKSGSYDILRGILAGQRSARELTWNWQFLSDKQPAMLNFLENHDEQRLASPWFAAEASKGYAALAFGMLFNNASYMIYNGQEIGETAAEGHEGRTSIFNWCKPLGLSHLAAYVTGGKGLNNREKSILKHYRTIAAHASREVFDSGQSWDLCYCNMDSRGFDPDRHFAFLRFNEKEAWLVFCNFSAVEARVEIRIPDELKHLNTNGCTELSAQPYDVIIKRIR